MATEALPLPRRSGAGKAGWAVMVILATLIAIYALLVLFIPGFGPPFIADRRAAIPIPLAMHLFGGAVALGTGGWQLNVGIRFRRVAIHRWLGRIYVVAVVIGAGGAGVMAGMSLHGMVTHLGFGFLAIGWLGTTLLGYRAIRRGEKETHRAWMLRSYALTLAAVTLRIYLPLSQIVGLPFAPSYEVISWLCWVPNLFVVEWLAVRRPWVVPVSAS